MSFEMRLPIYKRISVNTFAKVRKDLLFETLLGKRNGDLGRVCFDDVVAAKNPSFPLLLASLNHNGFNPLLPISIAHFTTDDSYQLIDGWKRQIATIEIYEADPSAEEKIAPYALIYQDPRLGSLKQAILLNQIRNLARTAEVERIIRLFHDFPEISLGLPSLFGSKIPQPIPKTLPELIAKTHSRTREYTKALLEVLSLLENEELSKGDKEEISKSIEDIFDNKAKVYPVSKKLLSKYPVPKNSWNLNPPSSQPLETLKTPLHLPQKLELVSLPHLLVEDKIAKERYFSSVFILQPLVADQRRFFSSFPFITLTTQNGEIIVWPIPTVMVLHKLLDKAPRFGTGTEWPVLPFGAGWSKVADRAQKLEIFFSLIPEGESHRLAFLLFHDGKDEIEFIGNTLKLSELTGWGERKIFELLYVFRPPGKYLGKEIDHQSALSDLFSGREKAHAVYLDLKKKIEAKTKLKRAYKRKKTKRLVKFQADLFSW